ncbi:MAG: hypothetical protein FWG16_05900, partial [Micrococcales bacterium]|nr:hypothetical protein [Micrococcales bacterium]
RATVQLAAYMVAICTLLLQGLTLPTLIRALKLSNDQEEELDKADEARVRLLATRAASRVVRGQVEAWAPVMGRPEAERIADWATQGLLARETAAATLLQSDLDDMAVTGMALSLPEGSAASEAIGQARQRLAQAGVGQSREELRKAAAALSVQIADLRTQMVRAQRHVVVAERNAGRLGETVMRRIMRELDLEEEAMEASWTHRL